MSETRAGGAHESVHEEPRAEGSSDRSFGLVMAVAFAVVGIWPLLGGERPRAWALVVSVTFLACALIRPRWLAPLNRLWTRFSFLLARVTNPLVMGAIFFLVVTPLGLAMRLTGRRPLELDFDPRRSSYWKAKLPPGPPPETMRRQF